MVVKTKKKVAAVKVSFATELAAAQVEFEPLRTSRTNAYGRGYPLLADIIAATRKALAAHGFSVTQHSGTAPENSVSVITRVSHTLGEMFDSTTLPVDHSGPEPSMFEVLAAETLAKRASMAKVLGIAAEVEAQYASSAAPPPPSLQPKAKPSQKRAAKQPRVKSGQTLAKMSDEKLKQALETMRGRLSDSEPGSKLREQIVATLSKLEAEHGRRFITSNFSAPKEE